MKTKKIITRIVTVLAVAMVAFSGIMKLSGKPEGVKMLESFGVGQYRILFGLTEILLAGLFAFPKTMRIGFILLSSYFAGALATELSHQSPFNSVIPLALVWIAAIVRDKYMFLPGDPVPSR